MESGKETPTPRWHGRHGAGAMRAHRALKRVQAETRNALTLPERRRKARRAKGLVK